MDKISNCYRCEGTGIAPGDTKSRYCRDCYGSGKFSEAFNFRADGRVELVCEHGIGHTVCIRAVNKPAEHWWIHGCDGCCKDFERYT